jgi:hypothetical protein
VPLASSPHAAQDGDACAELVRFTAGCRNGHGRADAQREQALEALLLRASASSQAATTPGACAAALLEVAALESEDADFAALCAQARERARALLAAQLRGERGAAHLQWLGTQLLLPIEALGNGERYAAIELLRGSSSSAASIALLESSRRGEPHVAQRALEALAGRTDAAVARRMLEALGARIELAPEFDASTALAHFARTRGALEPQARQRVADACAQRLGAASWREASVAIELTRALELDQALALLVAGLEHWSSPQAEPGAAPRVRRELASELSARTGMHYGTRAPAWRAWLEARKPASAPASAPAASTPTSTPTSAPTSAPVPVLERTSSEFFGLRPESGRVIFVIDRSGSMAEPMGTGHRSRFRECALQLERFLEAAGETTSFGIVLFDVDARAWRPQLQRATESARETALAWLRDQRPEGGTNLEAGVALACALGAPAGEVFTEADTLVLLCDGETAGESWIEPWLARVNSRARLCVHGVQIGTGGDRSLERLARATSGSFTRIAGY